MGKREQVHHLQKEEAEVRIEKLREKIKELNYKYFVLDESEVEESVRPDGSQ